MGKIFANKMIWVPSMTIALLFVATTADAGIAGSDHDFSTEGWNASGELCVVCHTPHNADVTVALAPLWNHDVTTAVYTIYASDTLDAIVGQPDGGSKLCLSCHDGTIALDSFGGQVGSTFIDADHRIGTDISDDHPISFTYDPALAAADGELFDPSTTPSSLGGTIDDDLLFGSQVECGSCHDVHDTLGNDDLLRVDNAGSALCLTCHDK